MERKKSRRLSGSRHFRQRLVLATLSFTDVTIDEIRSGDAAPGLRPHEVSLLRLLDKISDGTKIEINETGTDFPPSRELRFCAVRPRPPARLPLGSDTGCPMLTAVWCVCARLQERR
jgi:hypothetical protein